MALDEAVLDLSPPGALVLRFFFWKTPALTFGYGQTWEAAVRAAAVRSISPLQVVRRATGGGMVFHDGDLTFSLVFPWERLSSPCWIYKNIHRGIHQGLKEAGVKAALAAGRPAGTPAGPQAACFAGPEPMDIVGPGGEKVLGGALRRRGGRGLYQGSLRREGLGPGAPGRPGLEGAVERGLTVEFSAPLRSLEDSWIEEGIRREEKYRSVRWNQKR